MIYKSALKIFAVIIYFIFCGLAFNHIDPLAAIILSAIGIVFIINFFYNKIKDEN